MGRLRLCEGRVAQPSAAVIDSASVKAARERCETVLEIVKRSDDAKGIRCPASQVGRRANPGLDRQTPSLRTRLRTPDYERLPEHHETMVRWRIIRITSRRLTKQNQV